MFISQVDPMRHAIQMAEKAFFHNETPVGAVIVHKAHICVATSNNLESSFDPTGHAEMLAIRQACEILKTTHLVDCDLYVTLEPCVMCAQAISLAHIRRLYFGAYDPKGGGVEHGARFFTHPSCHHRPEVIGGLFEEKCGALLTRFFTKKRLGGML
ncbi:MAG: nucleoside deaminase [Holosporales bacterium]|nr:nucleoside deaminase [Holosporales bacterium]